MKKQLLKFAMIVLFQVSLLALLFSNALMNF